MATVDEKTALGLPSEASGEEVLEKIQELTTQAEEAKASEDPARIAELEKQLKGEQKKNEGLVKSIDELQTLLDQASAPGADDGDPVAYSEDGPVPEGKVRTDNGIEDLVEKRVKVLSCTWSTLEPSHLKKGDFLQKEHRATRGDVVKVPVSVARRYSQPDIDAFFETVDPPESASATGELPFSQMTESDLINWHRANSPSVKQVIDAAEGDPAVARLLVEAEHVATAGDPREEVIHGLSEIIGRDS